MSVKFKKLGLALLAAVCCIAIGSMGGLDSTHSWR